MTLSYLNTDNPINIGAEKKKKILGPLWCLISYVQQGMTKFDPPSSKIYLSLTTFFIPHQFLYC